MQTQQPNDSLGRLIARVEFARRCSSHGRPVAALLVTLAVFCLILGEARPAVQVLSWSIATSAAVIAAASAAASVTGQRRWELLVGQLTQRTEPEAFPALLDALHRAELIASAHASALERTHRLEQEVITSLQWHLDRPDRLAGVRLTPTQQERIHLALMSDHRDLVRAVLQAMPYLADEYSSLYVTKLAEGNWSAEYDAELRGAAAQMAASSAE